MSTSESSGVTSKNSSVKKPVELPASKESANKRTVKAQTKEGDKVKKQVAQQELDSSESEENESVADEVEESDEDESQIICTKTNKSAKNNTVLAKRKKQSGYVGGKQSVEKESLADKIIDKDTDVSCGASNGTT